MGYILFSRKFWQLEVQRMQHTIFYIEVYRYLQMMIRYRIFNYLVIKALWLIIAMSLDFVFNSLVIFGWHHPLHVVISEIGVPEERVTRLNNVRKRIKFIFMGLIYTTARFVIIGAMRSQITSPTIVYSTVCSGTDQRKHQSSASLTFVRGIHRWQLNFPTKYSYVENVSIWLRHHVDIKNRTRGAIEYLQIYARDPFILIAPDHLGRHQ